jgi:hypothetical protein
MPKSIISSAIPQGNKQKGRKMIEVDLGALLNGNLTLVSKYGNSQHAKWECEDNYIIGYSTSRIENSSGAKYDGKFACIVWKPIKSKGKIVRWGIVYFRAFNQRKKAKEYATKFYYQHSPKAAVRHGITQ